MTGRLTFIVRVEPGEPGATVEDVRSGRVARVGGLDAVGGTIAGWLAEAIAPAGSAARLADGAAEPRAPAPGAGA